MSVNLMCTLALRAALERDLLPGFEGSSGISVTPTWEPTSILEALIEQGERADVLVAVSSTVQRLAGSGLIESSSVNPLARVGVGVAVPRGHEQLPIDDEAALRRALLRATSVAYSSSGASGRYFTSVLEKLGIRADVEPRATVVDKGFTARALLDGRADLAVQQLSELHYVDGVDIVGPLPDAVQRYTEFSVGLFADSRDDALRLYKAITSSHAREVYQRTRLLPA